MSKIEAGSNSKLVSFLRNVADPYVYLHILRLINFYGYSHVRERRKMVIGAGTGMAPNVSIRNGDRIRLGSHCHIGERCCLWAGDSTGSIEIGDHVSFAPDVFVTASDYRFKEGKPFREQPRNEKNVSIGSDVWLGTRVVVTSGVAIGDGCIIGAGAVVTRNIPAGSIAVGVPAKVIAKRDVDSPAEVSPGTTDGTAEDNAQLAAA